MISPYDLQVIADVEEKKAGAAKIAEDVCNVFVPDQIPPYIYIYIYTYKRTMLYHATG